MTRDDILALADKVEKLEGPSREVDALIVTTLCPGATVSEYIKGEGDDIVFHAQAIGIRDKDCCPWFTHSLDAAMTLVPEGCAWALYSDGPTYIASAEIGKHPVGGALMQAEWSGEGETPALALTAASLRAIAERVG